MASDTLERGIVYFVGQVISTLASGIITGFIGLFYLRNEINRIYYLGDEIIGLGSFVLGSLVGSAVFRSWWKSMIEAQKTPGVAVILFVLMYLVLVLGMIVYAIS